MARRFFPALVLAGLLFFSAAAFCRTFPLDFTAEEFGISVQSFGGASLTASGWVKEQDYPAWSDPGADMHYIPEEIELPFSICFNYGVDHRIPWQSDFHEAYFVAFDDAPYSEPVFAVSSGEKKPKTGVLMRDCSPKIGLNGVLDSATGAGRSGTAKPFSFSTIARKMRIKIQVLGSDNRVVTDSSGKPVEQEMILNRFREPDCADFANSLRLSDDSKTLLWKNCASMGSLGSSQGIGNSFIVHINDQALIRHFEFVSPNQTLSMNLSVAKLKPGLNTVSVEAFDGYYPVFSNTLSVRYTPPPLLLQFLGLDGKAIQEWPAKGDFDVCYTLPPEHEWNVGDSFEAVFVNGAEVFRGKTGYLLDNWSGQKTKRSKAKGDCVRLSSDGTVSSSTSRFGWQARSTGRFSASSENLVSVRVFSEKNGNELVSEAGTRLSVAGEQVLEGIRPLEKNLKLIFEFDPALSAMMEAKNPGLTPFDLLSSDWTITKNGVALVTNGEISDSSRVQVLSDAVFFPDFGPVDGTATLEIHGPIRNFSGSIDVKLDISQSELDADSVYRIVLRQEELSA